MTEDKIKEQQPAAQPVRQPRRQKLRSLWAQFQCRGVLRRHRIRRKRQHRWEKLWHKLLHNPIAPMVGETLYAIGFSAEYAVVRTGRRLQHGLRRLLQTVRELLKNIASMAFPGAAQLLRDLFGPVVLALRGTWALLRHAHRVRKENGFGAALRASGHFLAHGIADNIRLVPRMAMYVLPVAALAVMVTVFQTTIRQPYALEVQVDNETVGYVANEEVFNSALEAVQQRINYSGAEQAHFTVEPTYSVTVAHDVMDENDVADAILKNSSDQISEGTALYLDGELTAVCADGNSLQRYISSLLEPYENPDDPNTTVGFNKDVTLENGIYFNESFQEEAEVEQLLSGVQQAEKSYTVQSGDTIWSIAQKNGLTVKELCEMNTGFTANGENGLTQNSKILPGDALTVVREEETLEVRITKVESWEEEIAYTTETTKSKELNSGTKRVTQKGENGIRTVTAQRVYDANGNQLSQQILSTVVTKEPVTEKVTVGTKKVSSGASYITGRGQFIWPVPGYRNCSRWYGGSHKGVDICAAAGLRFGRRYGDQGRLQPRRCGYRLRQLHHHQPRQRLHHLVRPLPVAGGARRSVGQAGSAHRLCGQHRTFQRQPLPLRDPAQRLLHRTAERVQPQQISVNSSKGFSAGGKPLCCIMNKKERSSMSTPHISAEMGDFAKTVLMPGDPLRAKFIADTFLQDVRQVTGVRGMLGFTGTYEGRPISVMGSGMGMPSIGIYSYELFNFYGVENIVRIGSAGSYTEKAKLFDTVLATGAVSESNYARVQSGFTGNITLPSAALNEKLRASAAKQGIPLIEGNIHSSDVFYRQPSDAKPTYWEKLRDEDGCLCVEMESFALFANAQVLGKNAACLLTISDSFVAPDITTAEERQKSFTDMMKVALGAEY